MALKLTVPDTIKPFLVRTEVKGVYGVDDWTVWLNRRFAKLGLLQISPEHETGQPYASKILGLITGKETSSLIIDHFIPEPDPSFFSKPRKLTLRMMYVEWGFEVVTTFDAVAARKVTVKGNPAVELVDINDIRIRLGIHVTSLGPKSGVEMGLFIRGSFIEMRPIRLSLNKIWFNGKLPEDIGPEGLIVEKASIKLGLDEPDVLFKLRAVPDRSGDHVGHLLEMEQISKLANFIERRWTNQSSRLAKESGKMDLAGARSEGPLPVSKRKIEDYLKPHYYLLGEDEEWVKRLGEFGVCVSVASRDIAEVFARFEQSRCDVIVGDADYWDQDVLGLADQIRIREKYSRVPLFWIAGPDNTFAESGGQELIDLGAYDFLDRTLPMDELKERFHWANPKVLDAGQGPSLAIVSREERQQYRLGYRLRSPEITVVKVNTPEAGIVSRLIDTDSRWIVVDTQGKEEAAAHVIKICLDWATRGQDPRDVFLIHKGALDDQVMEWKKMGAHDVIACDPSLDEVASTIHRHLEADLAEK